MFTGIIQCLGRVRQSTPRGPSHHLVIQSHEEPLCVGESIAVNGVCVTVTQVLPQGFACDLSVETCTRTTLSGLTTGDQVNLERALRVSDRLGGHWVTGHVDQIARIATITAHGDCKQLWIHQVHPEFLPLLVDKGSICVHGVSLTVNTLQDDGFSVMLIPQTLSATHLSECRVGDTVNLEFDTLAKIIKKQIQYYCEKTPH